MFDCAVPPDPIQSAANICPELTAGLPADQFEHIIIAGMDDDISTADMLDWVYPVLVAIPGGRWSSCEIEFQSGTPVRVRYRSGKTSIQIDDPARWPDGDLMKLSSLMPRGSAVVMIKLNDYASQAVSLMDGLARWISLYETNQNELQPVMRLFNSLAGKVKVLG